MLPSNRSGMRSRSLVVVAALGVVAVTGIARAEILRFQGDARIVVYEILTHGDWETIGSHEVDIQIEMTGPRYVEPFAYAVGSATMTRDDGAIVTIPLRGTISPPEGGGGLVFASGISDDGALYCFRIVDQVDAPDGPRKDKLVVAFEPLERIAVGHVEDNLEYIPQGQFMSVPLDNCFPLERLYASPIEGDFWFTTLLG